MLTLEERERRAYIEGRVEEAQLLAYAVDGDCGLVEIAEHETRQAEDEVEVEELLHDIDELRAQIRGLGGEPHA